MGVLQREPIPKLCFVMVLTICKDFLQIVRIVCHDLTDGSCPRLTPLPLVKVRKYHRCNQVLWILLHLCWVLIVLIFL